MIEISKIRSLSDEDAKVTSLRPFRAPHHSTTRAALIGGGTKLKPGEISLAHNGVLYLDEFPEFSTQLLESLRQPIESHEITLSRANLRTTYPSNFMLIATMNPCPCGYLGSNTKPCTCTGSQIQNYQKKLSGPLMDRIDMTLEVNTQANSVLLKNTTISTQQHDNAKLQIKSALNKQFNRYHNTQKFNGELTASEIHRFIKLSREAKQLLDLASERLQLSARSYFKIIKVAQTILDLSDSNDKLICSEHISEALQYRQQLKVKDFYTSML